MRKRLKMKSRFENDKTEIEEFKISEIEINSSEKSKTKKI